MGSQDQARGEPDGCKHGSRDAKDFRRRKDLDRDREKGKVGSCITLYSIIARFSVLQRYAWDLGTKQTVRQDSTTLAHAVSKGFARSMRRLRA